MPMAHKDESPYSETMFSPVTLRFGDRMRAQFSDTNGCWLVHFFIPVTVRGKVLGGTPCAGNKHAVLIADEFLVGT